MKLTLTRKIYTDRSTIGALDIDGTHQCDTLEDMTRRPDVKIWGKTAIPAGAYKVVITHSNRFKKELPLLLNQVHPIHEVVHVDYFLPGCPPSADAFWTFLTDLMAGRTPHLGHGLMHYD